MGLLELLLVVLVLAVVFWLLSAYVAPALPPPFGRVLLAIVALIAVVWLLSAIGLLPNVRLR